MTVEPLQECERCRVLCSPGSTGSSVPDPHTEGPDD